MVSVTQRIAQVKQPRGGYLPGRRFEKIQLPIKQELHAEENISPGLVGTVVDFLTRFALGSSAEEAFGTSLMGAARLGMEEIQYSGELLDNIKGLDNASIFHACKLAGYDVALRVGPMAYKPVQLIFADEETVENIRILVARSLDFFEEFGPVTHNGIHFGLETFSKHITSGDGDFATKDALWDFKVSKNPPKKEHTLQLLVYYLMGLQTFHLQDDFLLLEYLAIYNPRLQTIYRQPIADIPEEVIEEVKRDVIGY